MSIANIIFSWVLLGWVWLWRAKGGERWYTLNCITMKRIKPTLKINNDDNNNIIISYWCNFDPHKQCFTFVLLLIVGAGSPIIRLLGLLIPLSRLVSPRAPSSTEEPFSPKNMGSTNNCWVSIRMLELIERVVCDELRLGSSTLWREEWGKSVYQTHC